MQDSITKPKLCIDLDGTQYEAFLESHAVVIPLHNDPKKFQITAQKLLGAEIELFYLHLPIFVELVSVFNMDIQPNSIEIKDPFQQNLRGRYIDKAQGFLAERLGFDSAERLIGYCDPARKALLVHFAMREDKNAL